MKQPRIVLLAMLISASAVLGQEGVTYPRLPAQLEVRVPFQPTAFPSQQQVHLFYELHLTNFRASPLYLSRVEVLNADSPDAPPIAAFAAEQLRTMLEGIGTKASSDSQGNSEIAGGASAIVFVSIALNEGSHLPNRLLHRIVTTQSTVEGAIITTHYSVLHVLGPPLQGSNWLAHQAPSNDNHHRRGLIVLNGQPVISGRYAIDWIKVEQGAEFSGDSANVHSYYSYGKPVLAVADGRVVFAKDGQPDNVPGQDAFRPALPITLETQSGNNIVLDLGDGQFAHYNHLQPGSVRVKSGDRVRRGQVIAGVGASGDARGPHVHFEVTTSAKPGGEGLPYVIDSYHGIAANKQPLGLRKHELPL